MAINHLTLANLLSFGPGSFTVELGPLNVFIGPNGSGKSNLIDVLGLLQQLPTDLAGVIREGGGIEEWFWKGAPKRALADLPSVGVTAVVTDGHIEPLKYEISLGQAEARAVVAQECLTFVGEGKPVVAFNRNAEDQASPPPVAGAAPSRQGRSGSALSGRQDVLAVRWMADMLSAIRIYRDWPTHRSHSLRLPQRADHPDDFLLPGGENLGVILSAMQRHPESWDKLQAAMRRFHPTFQDVTTIVQGGTVQIFVRERGLKSLVPATRLSDGTLRYLCLLAVLLHPAPPHLVAIEEPEIGLHPDLIGDLARLLVEASERTQLVITTHSDHLVGALSDRPESVLVAERREEGTRFERLDKDRLKWWLERYSLGELWMKGEIGGTRW